jgi:hypothetical protein
MSSSAASFIDQINAEYREVVKAETSALPPAIRCGEFLTLAKENLKAEKGGKWSDWLETNCPEIAQETASLYMKLAKHKKLVSKAKSIREARKLLPKKERRGATQEPKPDDAGEPAGGFEPKSDNEPTFEDELEALAPDEVCTKLIETWDDDNKLAELAKLIGDYLQKKKTRPEISNTVTNSPAPAPSVGFRR